MKQGKVKFPAGKEFPNKFKPGTFQQNMVIEMEDGTEEKIYFASGRAPHANLPKGAPCNILYEQMNGRTIRKLYADDSYNNAPPVASANTYATPFTNNTPAKPRMSVEDKIAMLANAHVKCIQEVEVELRENGYPDVAFEDIRTIATSIMIKLDRDNDDLTELIETIETVEVEIDNPF